MNLRAKSWSLMLYDLYAIYIMHRWDRWFACLRGYKTGEVCLLRQTPSSSLILLTFFMVKWLAFMVTWPDAVCLRRWRTHQRKVFRKVTCWFIKVMGESENVLWVIVHFQNRSKNEVLMEIIPSKLNDLRVYLRLGCFLKEQGFIQQDIFKTTLQKWILKKNSTTS